MKKTGKMMLMMILLIYVLSPVDAVPGPIDDIVLIFLALGFLKDDDD